MRFAVFQVFQRLFNLLFHYIPAFSGTTLSFFQSVFSFHIVINFIISEFIVIFIDKVIALCYSVEGTSDSILGGNLNGHF